MNGALVFSIEAVETALAAAETELKGQDPHTSAYWDRHRDAMSRCGSELTLAVGADIDVRFDRCRVRIAGVTSTSTSGLQGALRNWVKAARAKGGA